MLCYDVHCYLTQIKVCSYTRRSSYSGSIQHILDNLSCQLSCRHLISIQISGNIHKHLVYGINVNVLRSNIFEIDIVNPRAVFHIVSHSGRSNDIIKLQCRICFQLKVIIGSSIKLVMRSFLSASCICFFNFLHDLKQSRSAGNTVSFERGRNSKTNCFLSSALIRNDKIGRQRVKSTLPALDRSVKGL